MKGRVWHSSGERRVRRPSPPQLALLPLIVMDARPPSPRYHLPPFSPWELRGVRMEVGREEGCYMAPIFPQFSFCCTPSQIWGPTFLMVLPFIFNRVFISSLADNDRLRFGWSSRDVSASGSGWKSGVAAKFLQPAPWLQYWQEKWAINTKTLQYWQENGQ